MFSGFYQHKPYCFHNTIKMSDGDYDDKDDYVVGVGRLYLWSLDNLVMIQSPIPYAWCYLFVFFLNINMFVLSKSRRYQDKGDMFSNYS